MATDSALRAITDDQAFRVMVVSTTETVRAAIASQRVKGATAKSFGELLTGAVLVRETMAPDLRVQALLESAETGKAIQGRGRLVADAHPRGETRGLVQVPKGAGHLDIERNAKLMVMRTLHDGSVHQGVVLVPDGGGVSGALMQYMQASEQVTSMVAVGCVFEKDEVVAAGGYIVQLLPGAPRGPLMLMTERLAEFETMDALLARGAAEPPVLMSEILYGIDHAQVGASPVVFKCQCSEERVAGSLATLPPADIKDLLGDGKVIDITCDYCGREYKIAPESLRGMVDAN